MALTDNLISCWELEEASGTRADAVVASANDLTDTNTVTSTTGKVGTCAAFATATSESLRINSNASLQVTSSFSVAAWVRMTTLGNWGMVTKWNIYSGSGEYALAYANGYGFAFNVRDSGNTTTHLIVHASGVKSTATWYFTTVVYDAAGPTIYINVNAGTRSSAAGPATPRSSTNAFCLGSYVQDNFLDGDLDQVCFWKRAISTAEETTLYNGGAGLSYAAMVGSGGIVRQMIMQNEG